MKIKYNSFWTKIYKFSTGCSNENVSADFFKYWFVVIAGMFLLPITSISKIVEILIPEIKWNIFFRLFVGLVLWSVLGCAGIIYWTADKTGYIVILWTILMYLSIFIISIYLVFIKFSFIGNHILHILYLMLNFIGRIYSKISIKPKLEFDKIETYIIIDIIRYTGIDRINFVEELDLMSYNDIKNRNIPIILNNDIKDYMTDDYVIYRAIKYGDDIKKGDKV